MTRAGVDDRLDIAADLLRLALDDIKDASEMIRLSSPTDLLLRPAENAMRSGVRNARRAARAFEEAIEELGDYDGDEEGE